MKVTVIGIGFVGLINAIGFAAKGHEVFALDPDKKKIAACIMLVSLFSLDQVYSHFYPHIGEGITEEMKENKREMIITTDTNLNKEVQEQVSD